MKIRILHKVTLLSNRTIRIVEFPPGTNQAPTNFDLTIDDGDYWLHSDYNIAYPGLYYKMQQALDLESTANSYEWRAGTPTLSSSRAGEGLSLVRTSGTSDFQLDLGNSNIDERLLGFPLSYSTAVDNQGDIIGSQFTRWGDWLPMRPIHITERDDRSFLEESSDDMSRDNWYQVNHGGVELRRFMMPNLPAANILLEHASDSLYAQVAGLATNDVHQALEHWHDAVRDGSTFIVVYDDVLEDLSISGHQREYCKLYGVDARSRFRSLVQRQTGRGGEFYDAQFTAQVISSGYAL